MDKKRRLELSKGIDIRDFRDLCPRDRLPDDPEDTRNLSEGERYWIQTVDPFMHRQLLQLLSVNAFLAQECSAK